MTHSFFSLCSDPYGDLLEDAYKLRIKDKRTWEEADPCPYEPIQDEPDSGSPALHLWEVLKTKEASYKRNADPCHEWIASCLHRAQLQILADRLKVGLAFFTQSFLLTQSPL